MIEIGEESHVVALWYVAGADRDWLACMTRDKEGYLLRYRFRYYADDQTFDSADEKSWWSARFGASVGADAEQAADQVAEVTAQSYRLPGKPAPEVTKLSVNGSGKKAMEMLAEMPFAHVRRGPG